MDINQWESVLSESLHSIRSLLCTATNQTPMNVYLDISVVLQQDRRYLYG